MTNQIIARNKPLRKTFCLLNAWRELAAAVRRQDAHSLGMYVDLHCCGFVENFVPFFIEEGFNSWGGQPLNDKPKLKKMYPGKVIL